MRLFHPDKSNHYRFQKTSSFWQNHAFYFMSICSQVLLQTNKAAHSTQAFHPWLGGFLKYIITYKDGWLDIMWQSGLIDLYFLTTEQTNMHWRYTLRVWIREIWTF